MEERTGEAFEFDQRLTVVGRRLQPGSHMRRAWYIRGQARCTNSALVSQRRRCTSRSCE